MLEHPKALSELRVYTRRVMLINIWEKSVSLSTGSSVIVAVFCVLFVFLI